MIMTDLADSIGEAERARLGSVATTIAQGFVSNPAIDWESKKVARTAVQFAKDLIHEVETTEVI